MSMHRNPGARKERREPGRGSVLVIGSANMDLVVTVKKFPQPGETLFGSGFGMYPGGKGANQAVACARLGAQTHFIAKMGNDVFRDRLMDSMKRSGVRLNHVLSTADAPTGIALICVDARAQNEIVVVSGNNMELRPQDLVAHRALFTRVRVVLLQLEIPLPTVLRASALARHCGAIVILNPAPAQKLPRSLLRMVDYLTPNETEIEALTGIPVRSLKSAELASRKLLGLGVGNVVVTMGKRGALLLTKDSARHFPAPSVRAVDTTAAGDAFNGALACALAQEKRVEDAVRLANAVAAFSVTRRGAQNSMPTMSALRTFFRKMETL